MALERPAGEGESPVSEIQEDKSSVWPLPRSLAATRGIDVSFSSSGYLDVSVPRVAFA